MFVQFLKKGLAFYKLPREYVDANLARVESYYKKSCSKYDRKLLKLYKLNN